MTKNIYPIPSDKCKDGAVLCLENANRLLCESVLLFESERYLTSCFLAIYAIEEIGKCTELLESFRKGEDITKTKWKRLTRGKAHFRKIRTGRRLAIKHLEEKFPFLKTNIRSGSILTSRYDDTHLIFSEHYQWLKEQFLYVGWEHNNWRSPASFSMTEKIVYATIIITEAFEAYQELVEELRIDDDIYRIHNRFEIMSLERLDYILTQKVPKTN